MYTLPNFSEKELIALQNILDMALKHSGIRILPDVEKILAKMQEAKPVEEAKK